MTDSPKAPGFVPPKDRPTVRVKPHAYQPCKAELEQSLPLPTWPDGRPMTPEEVARALMRPVNIVKDPDA